MVHHCLADVRWVRRGGSLPVGLQWVVVPIVHQCNHQFDIVLCCLGNGDVNPLERLHNVHHTLVLSLLFRSQLA